MTSFSCAKRAADPTNESAACGQWCGNAQTCPAAQREETLFESMERFYTNASPAERKRIEDAASTPPSEFCWLVELFHRGGPSLGRYFTGAQPSALVQPESVSTTDPLKATRYSGEGFAQLMADELNKRMHACEWRAVEHGFIAKAESAQ